VTVESCETVDDQHLPEFHARESFGRFPVVAGQVDRKLEA
jgi:hypothetical protein